MPDPTTHKILNKSLAAMGSSISHEMTRTLQKDPKIGPMMMCVVGGMGAAFAVGVTNYRHAHTRHHNMRKDVISDETLDKMPEAIKEVGDSLVRSVVYVPGYADNFEQIDLTV